MKKYVLFRFVPTMGCNYRCSYCFLPNEQKSIKDTMFDTYAPEVWVEGMSQWSDYDVEFYMWGGEPFSIPGTFDVVKGWTDYRHVVCNSRIDTNMFFADEIAKRCPTSKVKLNCSWHREYEDLHSLFGKVVTLQELEMVGMVNFVASTENIEHLREEYGMTIDDLVDMFEKIDVFLNVASDINVFESRNIFKKKQVKNLLSKYTCPEDWHYLREKMSSTSCEASKSFFTVNKEGDITTCLGEDVVGNFFEGTLEIRDKIMCAQRCQSLVAYPFRLDNDFIPRNSLMSYVERNKAYRKSLSK